jgi:hypothetical protein
MNLITICFSLNVFVFIFFIERMSITFNTDTIGILKLENMYAVIEQLCSSWARKAMNP